MSSFYENHIMLCTERLRKFSDIKKHILHETDPHCSLTKQKKGKGCTH